MVVDGRLMMGKQGFGGAVDPFKVDSNGLEFKTFHSIALHCIALLTILSILHYI